MFTLVEFAAVWKFLQSLALSDSLIFIIRQNYGLLLFKHEQTKKKNTFSTNLTGFDYIRYCNFIILSHLALLECSLFYYWALTAIQTEIERLSVTLFLCYNFIFRQFTAIFDIEVCLSGNNFFFCGRPEIGFSRANFSFFGSFNCYRWTFIT